MTPSLTNPLVVARDITFFEPKITRTGASLGYVITLKDGKRLDGAITYNWQQARDINQLAAKCLLYLSTAFAYVACEDVRYQVPFWEDLPPSAIELYKYYKWQQTLAVSFHFGIDPTIQKEEIPAISLQETCSKMSPRDKFAVALSFGKESLLAYKLIKGYTSQEPSIVITTNAAILETIHQEYQPIWLKQSYELFNIQQPTQLWKGDKLIGGPDGDRHIISQNFNILNFYFQLYPKQVLGCFLHLVALEAAINCDALGIDYVLFGNQHECNYRTVFPGGVTGYSEDYDQSIYGLGHLNYVLRDLGIRTKVTSLLYNTTETQTQWLLYALAPELFGIQISCNWQTVDKPWCNSCPKCKRIAFILKALQMPNPGMLDLLPYTLKYTTKRLDPLDWNSQVDEIAKSRPSGGSQIFAADSFEAVNIIDRNFEELRWMFTKGQQGEVPNTLLQLQYGLNVGHYLPQAIMADLEYGVKLLKTRVQNLFELLEQGFTV